MNKYIIITFLLSVILFSSLSIADTRISCLDNQTSQVNTSINVTTNGNIETIETSENIFCQYTCETNSGTCLGPSSMTIYTFAIAFLVLFTFIYLGYYFKLYILVLFAALFLLVFGGIIATEGILIGNLLHINLFTRSIGILFLSAGIYLIATVFG